MVIFSHAKLNLGLYITGKREDGYHNIESLFLPIKLYDAIELIPSKKNKLDCYGLQIPGETSSNSCLKTLDLLQREFQINSYHIHLLKQIPMGSGMGGGSSNSAFLIRLINQIEELELTNDQMRQLSLEIGSDNAFFIEDHPKYVTGRGDVIEPCAFDTQNLKAVLIIPDVHQSTKEAYQNITYTSPEFDLRKLKLKDLAEKKPINDFQSPFLQRYPDCEEILTILDQSGAIYSSLTGSGSCFFGLYPKSEPINPSVHQYSDTMNYKYFEVEFL